MTEQQPVFPKTEIMIPMRDGIRLQTFLYLPESKPPLPALLARCMYGADRVEKKVPFWIDRGYAVVLQNIRGRHKSEGGPVGREDHPEDGYDTIEWIVGQPWSNGRVGTLGRSALARVQTATAFLAHPAHRAMAPEVLPYKMMSHLGGAIMFSQIPQWMYWAQAGSDLNLYDAVDWMPHLYKLPATSVLDDVGGPIEEFKRIISDPLEVYF